MIRESLYFMFDNIKSTDFNITNVSISDGLYEEHLFARRTIVEEKIRGRDKPYFVEIQKEPLSFQMRFIFNDKWDDELIFKVVQWLDVDYYKPLSFSENMDVIFYAMPVDDIAVIHNGLKQGYVTLNIRCDSPYSYSPVQVSPWYECKLLEGGTFISPGQWVANGEDVGTIIELNNLGQHLIKPEMWIQKIGNGNVIIRNHSYGSEEFILTNLINGEMVYLNGENEIIESNLTRINRYNDFNDNYLTFSYGINRLLVEGDCKIRFKYQYKFS